MTSLTIVPNYEKKRLKLVGTVAAGEHVAVTVVGGGDWTQGGTLRLRALFGGKTVAVFPYYTAENEDSWPDGVVSADAWGGTEDATCELNLNTIQAEKMLHFGGECLWVLDDPANHTLYGTGEFRVNAWPKHRPVDVPYDLDNYPDLVKELSDDVAVLSAQLTLLDQNKVDKVAGKGLSTNDYTTADKTKLSGIEDGAQANVGVEFTQEEKTKLTGVAANANNYTLPAATVNTLGGVKQGTGCEITADGTLNVTGGGTDSVSWEDVTDKPNLAPVATSGSYDDLTDKPTIPAVDATLAVQGAAADAKAVGDALRGGFTEWEFSGNTQSGVVYTVVVDEDTDPDYVLYVLYANGLELGGVAKSSADELSVVFSLAGITATRHLITPTKTSQLTNDGAPNGGGTPYATTAQIPDVTSKADKVTGSTAGNLAALNAQGNLADSGVKPSDFAAKSDLPYRLVEPGAWEFSDGGSHVVSGPELQSDDMWSYGLDGVLYSDGFESESDALSALSIVFGGETTITATRASLPGHLLDRAGNRVVVTGDTTLTLPAANPGYLRDFLVRLEISGSTVPTITFAAPTGETITYETDGDEFPVPDEAGDWLYSFTESCVAHKFAVSLKKVNTVAQGGS